MYIYVCVFSKQNWILTALSSPLTGDLKKPILLESVLAYLLLSSWSSCP